MKSCVCQLPSFTAQMLLLQLQSPQTTQPYLLVWSNTVCATLFMSDSKLRRAGEQCKGSCRCRQVLWRHDR